VEFSVEVNAADLLISLFSTKLFSPNLDLKTLEFKLD